jgi:methylthioribose-1-phosphate isomerase
MIPPTIEWISGTEGNILPGHVRMIDQTRLPLELSYLETADVETIWRAIKTLQVRGAPAIGIAAGFGVLAGIQSMNTDDPAELAAEAHRVADHLATSRPTAVNLFWALDRMRAVASAGDVSVGSLKERLAREALAMAEEDAAMCRAIGEHGLTLLDGVDTVLTHCNAGSLATARFGTALSPVYAAREKGRVLHVYADETRPLLQGARLTAWELMHAGVEVTLICDNTAAHVMKSGRVGAVLVGADRIVANGDAANKIGTYGLAVLARAHNIPFYVLAPTSTMDLGLSHGGQIPIEERAAEEVTEGFGTRTAPEGVKVYAPAFDVTPAELITAMVCEKGIIRPPYHDALEKLSGAL